MTGDAAVLWERARESLRAAETVLPVSARFEPGEHGQVAVKVIDDRGNELLVVKGLKEAQ